jgi:hypothetical protein
MGWINANGIWIGRNRGGGISWQTYWKTQPEVLFFGLYSEISGGQMPNKVTGATDYLTVAGAAGSETYQCPNTAAYIAADTDNLWFKWNFEQRTVTTAELIGYDFSNTPVRYGDAAPNSIEAIIILSTVPSGAQLDRLFRDMKLPIYWNGVPNVNGYLKSNRGLSRSVFTPDANLIVTDTFSDAWYKPQDSNGLLSSLSGGGFVDMLVGQSTFGATLTTGTTTAWKAYKIITTTPNYFFTGCQMGDIFVESSAKGLNVNNSVQLVTGNHAVNHTTANLPVNGTFNGSSQFLRGHWTSNQPTFLYAVVKLITWTAGRYLFDGGVLNCAGVQCSGVTPKIIAYAGTALTATAGLTLGTKGIIRIYFNGASSKLIINNDTPTTGDAGANNSGGIAIGANGGTSGGAGFCNEKVYEVIRRTSDASEADIYAYLKNKIDLGLYTD